MAIKPEPPGEQAADNPSLQRPDYSKEAADVCLSSSSKQSVEEARKKCSTCNIHVPLSNFTGAKATCNKCRDRKRKHYAAVKGHQGSGLMYSAGMLPVALPYNAGSAGQLVGSLQPAEQPLKAPRDYRCGYCGIPRTSSSTDANRRVRIRCGCGGITQDQNTRTHEHWLPLSRIPLYSFLVELPDQNRSEKKKSQASGESSSGSRAKKKQKTMVTKDRGVACSLPAQASEGSVPKTEHLDIDLFYATLMGKKNVLEAGWVLEDESQPPSGDILDWPFKGLSRH